MFQPSRSTSRRETGADRDPGVIEAARIAETCLRLPLAENLGDLLDSRAHDRPHAQAVVFFQDGVELDYGTLADRSARLASGLLALGVRKGTHVAMMLPNCEAFVVSWFALARIGAVAVPLNTAYTSRELAAGLNDSDAQFLIIDGDLACEFRAVSDQVPLICADAVIVVAEGAGGSGEHRAGMRAANAAGAGANSYHRLVDQGCGAFVAPEPVGRSDLMSIQYTSGTTGPPKGCLQSHLYWLMLSGVGAVQRRGAAGLPNERVLVTYPLHYMMAQFELLLAMQVGGTAFVARRPSRRQFVDWIRRFRIHYCAMNPMVYRGLPRKPDDGDNELRFVAAYYHRGDALRELEARFEVIGRDIWGMTETGVGTMVPVAATHMLDTGTCGLPGPFRELSIRDSEGNELPVGQDGELCVRGPGMFWGYYKRPQDNRNAFHGRWFRTGDLARVDERGYVFIVGRLKDMIKRGGENISAAEVEAVLREHPGVHEAAALAVPDPDRREEVKVYVSLREGWSQQTVPPSALLEHCRDRLAAFKLPRYVAYIDQFPRLGSHKIAKQRLIERGRDPVAGSFDLKEGIWL